MAILKNVEIWYTKCDPKRPSKKLSPKNPTWETQIRTTSKDVRKEWTSLNIKSKAVREDKTDDESPILYYSANLKKKSLKEDGSESAPVSVVNGRGADIDPNTIGNGSIANIRIFQHPYSFKGEDGSLLEGVATMLMAIQLVKHVVYVPKPMEEFDEVDTETVDPAPADDAGSPKTAADDSEY
jgi:hypothetical protein